MNSHLYYDQYHHHDPTIISVHTLLKAQAYQQSTYFNTPPSQFSQYISPPSIPYINQPLLPSNSTHINTHPASATEQYWASHTPVFHQHPTYTPNFTYQQPITTSTTVLNPNFNQHSHDPFPPPKSTSFTHHNFTYNNTTTASPKPNWGSYKPLTQQPPVTTCIDQHLQHRPNSLSLSAPLNCNPLQRGKDEIVQPHELVDGKFFFTSFDSNSHDTVDEKKFVNNADVDIVTEPTHFDVVGESIFTILETDEKLETRDEVTKDNFTDTVVTQALEEEIKSAQDLIANFNPVSNSVESLQKFFAVTSTPSPEKTVASTLVVAAPPPRHLFICDSGADERRVRSLAAIFGNGICVFDPGGDKFSPAEDSGDSRHIFSLLWLPWDRGKKSCSEAVFALQSCSANACL